jgi:hypothetical protein
VPAALLLPAPLLAGSTHSTDDAVSAALETVLYAQMLILFAPQAVPAKSHLPVLVRCSAGGQQGHCLTTQHWCGQKLSAWLHWDLLHAAVHVPHPSARTHSVKL